MQLRFDGMFAAVILSTAFACASVVPDWNARPMDRTDNKPRVEVVISPWGPRLCDQQVLHATGGHMRRINIVISQHNREFEHVFIMDNKKKGFRYMPHQSVSLALSAGIGIHLLEYGTFIPDEDGKVKKITWRGKRRMVVRCCHGKDPLGRIAGGS